MKETDKIKIFQGENSVETTKGSGESERDLKQLMLAIKSSETLERFWETAVFKHYSAQSDDESESTLQERKILEDQLEDARNSISQLLSNSSLSDKTMPSLSGRQSLFNFIYPRISVQVYLADGGSSKKVEEALEKVLYALGSKADGEAKIKHASWSFSRFFRSFIPKTEETAASSVKDALEIMTIDKVKAESDAVLAAAVAGLISSLQNESHAAVRVGTILIVKNTEPNSNSTITTCTLSPFQSKRLDKEPELLKSPSTLLDSLGISNTSETSVEPPHPLDSPLDVKSN